jgi:hypothetical protein
MIKYSRKYTYLYMQKRSYIYSCIQKVKYKYLSMKNIFIIVRMQVELMVFTQTVSPKQYVKPYPSFCALFLFLFSIFNYLFLEIGIHMI